MPVGEPELIGWEAELIPKGKEEDFPLELHFSLDILYIVWPGEPWTRVWAKRNIKFSILLTLLKE